MKKGYSFVLNVLRYMQKDIEKYQMIQINPGINSFNIDEFAAAINVTKRTVEKYIQAGLLPATRFSHNRPYVSHKFTKDLLELMIINLGDENDG